MTPSPRALLACLVPVAVAVPLLLGGCRADPEPADPEPGDPAAGAEAPIPAAPSPTLDVTDTELVLQIEPYESVGVSLADSATAMRFVSAALRPGSTEERATIVAIVATAGGHALRWMAVSGGDPGPLRPFPPRFDHMLVPPDHERLEPSVTWIPDGGSIGWTGWSAGGVANLQTVGWDDGPGTGEPATDNASFVLEPVPAGSRFVAWREIAPATWQADLESPDGRRWILLMERQADGALALPTASPGNPCPAPCDPR